MIEKNFLSIDKLSVKYGRHEPVVKEVSMSIGRKEIVGIVGESGSGKSTLLRALLGILPIGSRICSGNIVFKDKELIKLTKKEWSKIRGNRMGMIFQDAGRSLTPILKIGDQYIETIRSHFNISKAEAYDKSIEMLEKMQLPNAGRIMNSYPFELSGGMKQRVAIAIAMTMEPELLLADEPTSALDVTVQAQVVRQMMELRNSFDTSIMIVTHNIGVAAYMCDRIGVMFKGELLEYGTKDQVINHPKSEYTRSLLAAVPELGGFNIEGKERSFTENNKSRKEV